LANLPTSPLSLYIDLEGVKLGRRGSISILSLYLATTKKVYLVDIHIPGGTALSTRNGAGDSLKTILEASIIPKVFFDIRNNSDALFSHYQISVDGVKDLQLMELSTRIFSKKYVAGQAKCIQNCDTISSVVKAEWHLSKDGAGRLHDSKKGGRYVIFNERPMKPEIEQYCARDEALLPELCNVNSARLRPAGQALSEVNVRTATAEQARISKSTTYDGEARSNVLGPWNEEQIEQDTEEWNDDILMMTNAGMVLNDN
jgi:exonuclease 3'-5' domain-containing protein 1